MSNPKPTECEVALLRLRASTVCSKCDDGQQHAARLREIADYDAKDCKVQLTQLVQRELSILCTDAYHATQRLRDEMYFAHPDASTVNGQRALVAGCDAQAAMEDIYKRLRALLERAITPSAKAHEWVAHHIDNDGDPDALDRAITASDCTLGRLEP